MPAVEPVAGAPPLQVPFKDQHHAFLEHRLPPPTAMAWGPSAASLRGIAGHRGSSPADCRNSTKVPVEGEAGRPPRLAIGQPLADMHDELANLARNVDRMAECLESLLTSQRLLCRHVSYKLRSPL